MNTITFERKIKEKEIETITFCLRMPEIYKTRNKYNNGKQTE